jgi:formiminoglutamase
MTYKQISPVTGRIDGIKDEELRWHQIIKYIDLEKDTIKINSNQKAIVFLGFEVDEGVRRNQGRMGAKDGHQSIIKALANLPKHFENDFLIFHAGIITCDDGDLEQAQLQLASYVAKILASNCIPVVLGGGHEVTYGHYLGINNFIRPKNQNAKIAIINVDAHFDIRPINKDIGATSGTSIWQIATEARKNSAPFDCLALGIQKYANTKQLFNLAQDFGVKYISGDKFNYDHKTEILKEIDDFINSTDHIYLTICMDVFAAPYCPAVSATSYNGIVPDNIFIAVFEKIIRSDKLIALDFAELNPKFDIDMRSAKLAASLIFKMVDCIGDNIHD